MNRTVFWIQVGFLTLATASVSACSTPTWTSPPGSERYQIGYKDGCDAGYAVAGSPFYDRIDSATAPEADADYQSGWQFGFTDCKASYNHFQATVHSMFGTGH